MTITWRQLITAVLTATTGESATMLDHVAGVWPPSACPETSFVPLTGVTRTKDGKLVLSTGKEPVLPVPPVPLA